MQTKSTTNKEEPPNKKGSENAEKIYDNLKPIFSNDQLNGPDEVFSFEAKLSNGENIKKAPSIKKEALTNGMTKSTNSNEMIDSVCTTDSEFEPELEFIPRRNRSTVSRVNDETDNWGEEELTNKEEHFLTLKDDRLKVY